MASFPIVGVAACHVHVVVMPPHVLYAFGRQPGDAFFVQHQFLQGAVDVLLVGHHVDNGAQLRFAYQLVVLGFAASYHGDALAHGHERVHRGRVGIELVELHVGIVHQLLVAGEGHVLDLGNAAQVGVLGLHGLQHGVHHVRAFVVAARCLYADEEVQLPGYAAHACRQLSAVDGQGDEGALLGDETLVGGVVLPQAGDDAIARLDNLAGGPRPSAGVPLGQRPAVGFRVAVSVANLEVGVTVEVGLQAGFDVVVVRAEGTEEYLAVVPLQVAVDGQGAGGLQAQEVGADDLHHVVAPERRQVAQGACHDLQAVRKAVAGAGQVNVAWVVFPAVAVGGHADPVPQGTQALSQVPVQAASFAKQEYVHSA